MILIGMFDSPFVRRVAVSMKLLGLDFEHRNWSVGKDQAEIRRYNPLGRVPTLVLDDGEALAESFAILDFLDQSVGPARALLPASGRERRDALQLMALASGAAERASPSSTKTSSVRRKSATSPGLNAVPNRCTAAWASLSVAVRRPEPGWSAGA
ncbi:MAG TPA: glutathione S-transferase family protein [Fontimonas sp.]